jgi:7,8-dihydropterin-6-yl-methyl-4-(beta-D-ribofuranosyl)aminobenzene 5'-phosphate synthase
MKVTIIYDNTVLREDLKADWGFAALVEAHGKKILFDTGGSGSILLANMKALAVDPQVIGDVFISHAHYDHTGGLSAFLDQNRQVRVWVPPSFKGVTNVREVIKMERPGKLYEGIFSTGELEGVEQSLCVETAKGIVVVAGCSHPPMGIILDAASKFGPVYGIIGGFHSNRPESLKEVKLICATHCTQYKAEIQSLYPDAYLEGGAGKIITVREEPGES